MSSLFANLFSSKKLIGNIYCVFVQYGDDNTESSLLELGKWIKVHFKKKYEVQIVENDISRSLIDRNYSVFHGSNKNREFTGYEEGLSLLRKRYELKDNDIIIFCNDTFTTNYGNSYLWGNKVKKIINSLSKNAAVGYIDEYPSKVFLKNCSFKSWIRTSFFAIPYSVVKSINFDCLIKKSEVFTLRTFQTTFSCKKVQLFVPHTKDI